MARPVRIEFDGQAASTSEDGLQTMIIAGGSRFWLPSSLVPPAPAEAAPPAEDPLPAGVDASVTIGAPPAVLPDPGAGSE